MPTEFPAQLQEAARSLIENLLASETFIHYQQARSRLQGDGEANALLEQMTQAQAYLRQKQAEGTLVQTDYEELREIQTKVQHHHVIMNYAESQQEAVKVLSEINTEISQFLGMNFAVLAQRSTC